MTASRRTTLIFAVTLAALAVTLLAPLPLGDPNGTDPHEIRLGAVVVALVAATFWRDLRPSRPLLLAFAVVVIPFVLWSVSLQVVPWWWPTWPGGAVIFAAGLLQFVITVALIEVLKHNLGAPITLRLAHFGTSAAVFTATGVVLFVAITLALPASALGRVGIAVPAALDALGNGLIAGDVLQAGAQEIQFRGALLALLESTLRPWQANAAQSVLFGFGHLALEQYEGPVVVLIPLTIGLGFVLGWVTQRTRSLWPAIIIHIVAEVAVRVAVIPGLYGG
jgi:membrane protease YdiL (CAAX protease family)